MIGFWAEAASGTGLAATITVRWRDASNAVIGSDTVTLDPLGSGWQPVSALVTAPPGTVAVDVTISNSTGGPGDSLYLDDVVVADR